MSISLKKLLDWQKILFEPFHNLEFDIRNYRVIPNYIKYVRNNNEKKNFDSCKVWDNYVIDQSQLLTSSALSNIFSQLSAFSFLRYYKLLSQYVRSVTYYYHWLFYN